MRSARASILEIKDFDDVYNAIMKDKAARLKLGGLGSEFTQANVGDGSPLYECGFADISATLSASSNKEHLLCRSG